MSRYRIHLPALATVGLLAFALPGSAARAQSYNFVDLGSGVTPTAINSTGQVVGFDISGSNTQTWVLYTGGHLYNEPTLGGTGAGAEAINNAGQVVGEAETPNGSEPFLYSNGAMQDLNDLISASSGWTLGSANCITNSGQIVGSGTGPGGPAFGTQFSCFYGNGSLLTDLTPLPPTLAVSGINNSGTMVGTSDATNPYQAAEFQNGKVTSLGTLPSPYNYQSGASGINDAGQIIGESGRNFDGGSQSHAFLYDDGSMIDLGTLGGLSSYAEGINSVGQVVGYSNYSSGGTGAFLYENGKMMDLNGLISPGSGWTLQGATGINDSGWIIGVGNYGGFLLIPTPEPTALATLTIGAGLALAHRRNLTMPIARIRVTPTHCKHSGMLSLKNHAMTAPAFD